MAYRDDMLALESQEEALRVALANVEAALADRAVLEADAKSLRSQLTTLQVAKRRAAELFLGVHPLKLKKPCRVPWSSMQGSEHVRHCVKCNEHVYNLSGLTSVQVARLLAEREHGGCVRFFQRADGSLVTSDCSARSTVVGPPLGRLGVALAGVGALTVATLVPQPSAHPANEYAKRRLPFEVVEHVEPPLDTQAPDIRSSPVDEEDDPGFESMGGL
jgi:hypothetical protein